MQGVEQNEITSIK